MDDDGNSWPRTGIASIFERELGSWAAQAVCLSADPETFFPDKGGSIEPATRICNGDRDAGIPPCPVRRQCLEYAIDNDENDGVWGGVSARGRRKMMRYRREGHR